MTRKDFAIQFDGVAYFISCDANGEAVPGVIELLLDESFGSYDEADFELTSAILGHNRYDAE
jgi:hypothetical protein